MVKNYAYQWGKRYQWVIGDLFIDIVPTWTERETIFRPYFSSCALLILPQMRYWEKTVFE